MSKVSSVTSVSAGAARRTLLDQIIKDITGDPHGVHIDLKGNFSADHKIYSGTLVVGARTYQVEVENFNPSFAMLNTALGKLPAQFNSYRDNKTKPITVRLNGTEQIVFSHFRQRGATEILTTLGTFITKETP